MNMSTCCLSLRCIRYDVVTRRVLREKRWSSKFHFPPPTSNPWKSFALNVYFSFVYFFNDVHGWKSAHFLQPSLAATDARVAFIHHINYVCWVWALGSIPMAMFAANDAMIAPIDIIVGCLARWLCIAGRFARTLIFHLLDKTICARINDNWIYYVRNACAERRRAINLFCFAFRDVRMHASICNHCKWKHGVCSVARAVGHLHVHQQIEARPERNAHIHNLELIAFDTIHAIPRKEAGNYVNNSFKLCQSWIYSGELEWNGQSSTEHLDLITNANRFLPSDESFRGFARSFARSATRHFPSNFVNSGSRLESTRDTHTNW